MNQQSFEVLTKVWICAPRQVHGRAAYVLLPAKGADGAAGGGLALRLLPGARL